MKTEKNDITAPSGQSGANLALRRKGVCATMGRMKAPASFLFSVLAASAALAQDASAPRFVEITGNRVNLRAAPKPDGEVLAQASIGDILPLHGEIADPWVAVGVPDKCDLWIRSDLVRGGEVRVDGARLRSGAGTQFTIVGSLPLGTPLEIRGTAGEWSRVAPPSLPGVSLYVTNAYVNAAEPKADKATAAESAESGGAASPVPPPPAQVAPTPSVDLSEPTEIDVSTSAGGSPQPPSQTTGDGRTAVSSPAPVPEAPPLRDEVTAAAPEAPPPPPKPVAPPPSTADRGHVTLPPPPPDRSVPVGPAKIQSSRLDASRIQASDGEYAGLLASAPAFGSHPTKFRLIRMDRHNTPETVCWVYGNTEQLNSLRGSAMTISGAVYWFKGCDIPVVFAQEILTSGKRR